MAHFSSSTPTLNVPSPTQGGTSEDESGAHRVCPQGVTISWFNGNEAHNNGRYGLRIFTGRSPHNGEGMPGFYPKSALPCAPVSPTNQFKTVCVTAVFTIS